MRIVIRLRIKERVVVPGGHFKHSNANALRQLRMMEQEMMIRDKPILHVHDGQDKSS